MVNPAATLTDSFAPRGKVRPRQRGTRVSSQGKLEGGISLNVGFDVCIEKPTLEERLDAWDRLFRREIQPLLQRHFRITYGSESKDLLVRQEAYSESCYRVDEDIRAYLHGFKATPLRNLVGHVLRIADQAYAGALGQEDRGKNAVRKKLREIFAASTRYAAWKVGSLTLTGFSRWQGNSPRFTSQHQKLQNHPSEAMGEAFSRVGEVQNTPIIALLGPLFDWLDDPILFTLLSDVLCRAKGFTMDFVEPTEDYEPEFAAPEQVTPPPAETMEEILGVLWGRLIALEPYRRAAFLLYHPKKELPIESRLLFVKYGLANDDDLIELSGLKSADYHQLVSSEGGDNFALAEMLERSPEQLNSIYLNTLRTLFKGLGDRLLELGEQR